MNNKKPKKAVRSPKQLASAKNGNNMAGPKQTAPTQKPPKTKSARHPSGFYNFALILLCAAVLLSTVMLIRRCSELKADNESKFTSSDITLDDLATLLDITAAETTTDSDTTAYETASETASETAEDDDAWQLMLVNRVNPLPDDFSLTADEMTELPGGELVDSRIYEPLMTMLSEMENDGKYGIVVSGYRTAEFQQSLLDSKYSEYLSQGMSESEAKEKAESWVAVPGTSEHQLGIAVDINADGIHSAGYEVYEWLAENSYKYGFIRRYPEDKTEITGFIYEPWHYRYVGDEAEAIYLSGLCLEEYLEAKTSADTNE